MKFTLFASLVAVVTAATYDLSISSEPQHDPDQCTAILVSAGAANDGVGSMTTHTNDCLVSEDIRILYNTTTNHERVDSHGRVSNIYQVV